MIKELNNTTMTSTQEISGKKIADLISEGILPAYNQIPNHGFTDRDYFEAIVEQTDAYNKFFGLLTKAELKGSKKQINWGIEIRQSAAKKAAFEMVINSIYFNSGNPTGIDFNKYAHGKVKEFAATNAAWWIENRRSF